MSTGLYTHTTRSTGTVLTAAIYNGDHVNHITNQNPSMTGAYSDNVTQMQASTDPGGVGTESLAGSLAGELERIRFAIKRLAGAAQWYAAALAVWTGNNLALPGNLSTVGDVAITGNLSVTGSVSGAGGIVQILNRAVAQVIVANTGVETSVYSFSVAGGTLGTNKRLRLTVFGDCLNNSGGNSNLTVRAKYGATTFGTLVGVVTTAATRQGTKLTIDLMALNATGAQMGVLETPVLGVGSFAVDGVSGSTLVHQTQHSAHNAIAEDSTAAKNLVVTVQHSVANAAIDFHMNAAFLEWM